MRIRIGIDSGHGGDDPGAIGSTLKEKDLTLEISKMIRDNLTSRSIDTFLTKEEDVTLPMRDRIALINKENLTLCVSVHINAFPSKTAHGYETYHFPGSFEGRLLAQMVNANFVDLDASDRGVKAERFDILRFTNCPAILTETLFISNPEEEGKLSIKENRVIIADAISDGIIGYLRSKGHEIPEPKKESDKNWDINVKCKCPSCGREYIYKSQR